MTSSSSSSTLTSAAGGTFQQVSSSYRSPLIISGKQTRFCQHVWETMSKYRISLYYLEACLKHLIPYYYYDNLWTISNHNATTHFATYSDTIAGDTSFDEYAGLYDVSHLSDKEELLNSNSNKHLLPSPNTRIGINTTTAIPIKNDNFIGQLVVIHRRPTNDSNVKKAFPYEKFMRTCPKVRCELRWQGRFLKPPGKNMYFGIEGYQPTPKLNIMARITARILMSISKRLAAANGSKLISNFPNTSDNNHDTRTWFLFPLTSADTVIEHDQEHDLPDITADEGIYGTVTADHQFDTEHIYTFCYWSMFVDFVTWDLRNLPAISGTSLCTLLGPQPIHIIMQDDHGTNYMNILSAHRSFSPLWAKHLQRPRHTFNYP